MNILCDIPSYGLLPIWTCWFCGGLMIIGNLALPDSEHIGCPFWLILDMYLANCLMWLIMAASSNQILSG
jgi:hypothetical protein